jgi:tetratricopeptide (TPR) repeat protein
VAEPKSEQRAAAIARHFHEAGRDDLAREWAWAAASRAADLYAHEETLLHTEAAAAFGRDDGQVAVTRAMAQVALARYEDALVTLRRAASLTAPDEAAARARIGRLTAEVHVRRGEWDLARAELRGAVGLLEAGEPAAGRAHLLADQAVVALRAGDLAAAERHVVEARTTSGGPDAFVLDVAGQVALAAGDAPVALAAFEEALGADPDEVLQVALLNNLATAQAAVGRLEAAEATARSALEIGEAHRDRHRLAALHANLADRLRASGKDEEAMAHLKSSAALMAEVGADPLERPDVWTLTSW